MCVDEVEVVRFLMVLYKNGNGYSAINTARCALSTIMCNASGVTIGSFASIKRFVKGVFETRPPRPRYTFIWDANIVLEYLRNFCPIKDMPLSYVTLKLVMLLALATAQRAQTLHSINVENIQISGCLVTIPITKPLKQSTARNFKHSLNIKRYNADKRICPVKTLEEYLERTKYIRNCEKQLFVSYLKPHRAVSKSTISRWLKMVLEEAGVDTKQFKAHSVRSAACANLKRNDVPIDEILKTAGWSNEKTFKKFYDKVIMTC